MTLDEQFAIFLARDPTIDPTAYIAPGATLIGDVRIAAQASVWPGSVLRGDINFIEIGESTNVQDGTIIHLSDDYPVRIGKFVTIGHAAMLHACTIEDECLIGMRATVLDGAVIGRNSIIGAQALVTQGMIVPPGSLVLGVPGKIARPDGRPGEGESKRVLDPEGRPRGKEQKKQRGEAGHPQVERRDPASPLPPRRARAVTQGDGEEDHAAESDDHQKEQGDEKQRHREV